MSPTITDASVGLDLSRDGTPESAWLEALSALAAQQPPVGRRVVVVGPHPDDETLGVGGIISMLAAAGASVSLVLLSDGEAASDEADLAERRHVELLHALAILGGGTSITTDCLHLPDGDIAAHADAAAGALSAILGRDDVVLAPLENDGHCDHDAAGAISRRVCEATGAALWFYPVWAWHWHRPETSDIVARGVRVPLSLAAIDAKQQALQCFTSQFTGDAPVVPADMLARSRRPFEVLVRP